MLEKIVLSTGNMRFVQKFRDFFQWMEGWKVIQLQLEQRNHLINHDCFILLAHVNHLYLIWNFHCHIWVMYWPLCQIFQEWLQPEVELELEVEVELEVDFWRLPLYHFTLMVFEAPNCALINHFWGIYLCLNKWY